jgi:hypothetical protein
VIRDVFFAGVFPGQSDEYAGIVNQGEAAVEVTSW